MHRGCPQLYSYLGASAAALLPTFRRNITLPRCSDAFTIGEFLRWWHSTPAAPGVGCVSEQTPCPRSCSGRRTLAAAVLPSFRRNITLAAGSHAFTIGEFRRWCGTAPLHAAPTSGGWRLIPTGLPLCLAFEAGLHPN